MLLDLPSELVVKIVCFLPVESIGRFVCVNKRCKMFGYDDFVWRMKLREKIYPILYENLHNTLQYSGIDSWREVYMSLYSLQQLYSTNNGIQSSFTVKSSVYGSFTGTHTEFFPLLCSGTSSFLQLQAIPRDINDLNMSQVLNWLQQIHVSRYPEPNGYYYVLKETGSVYYEATMIKPDIEIPSIRTPAMGIGLFLDNNFQVGEGRFPGWYDNSLGYHSDDGKIFFSVSYIIHLNTKDINNFIPRLVKILLRNGILEILLDVDLMQ